MTLRGLIFDFDGLILDTELPEYHVWKEFFKENGADLPLSEWVKCIGASFEVFNPYTYLEQLTGRTVDRAEVRVALEARSRALILKQEPLPGVTDLIAAARRAGLRVAVASSSPQDWVTGHLTRLEMLPWFDAICTGSQVTRVKPAPDLYRLALEQLRLNADEAVALEDSVNGVTAAKEAGLYCVAVPNAVTRQLDFQRADLVLSSMADLSLERLTHRFHQALN